LRFTIRRAFADQALHLGEVVLCLRGCEADPCREWLGTRQVLGQARSDLIHIAFHMTAADLVIQPHLIHDLGIGAMVIRHQDFRLNRIHNLLDDAPYILVVLAGKDV